MKSPTNSSIRFASSWLLVFVDMRSDSHPRAVGSTSPLNGYAWIDDALAPCPAWLIVQAMPTVHECPKCGAPLRLRRVHKGMLDCEYCGQTIAIASCPALAAEPALVQAMRS